MLGGPKEKSLKVVPTGIADDTYNICKNTEKLYENSKADQQWEELTQEEANQNRAKTPSQIFCSWRKRVSQFGYGLEKRKREKEGETTVYGSQKGQKYLVN